MSSSGYSVVPKFWIKWGSINPKRGCRKDGKMWIELKGTKHRYMHAMKRTSGLNCVPDRLPEKLRQFLGIFPDLLQVAVVDYGETRAVIEDEVDLIAVVGRLAPTDILRKKLKCVDVFEAGDFLDRAGLGGILRGFPPFPEIADALVEDDRGRAKIKHQSSGEEEDKAEQDRRDRLKRKLFEYLVLKNEGNSHAQSRKEKHGIEQQCADRRFELNSREFDFDEFVCPEVRSSATGGRLFNAQGEGIIEFCPIERLLYLTKEAKFAEDVFKHGSP